MSDAIERLWAQLATKDAQAVTALRTALSRRSDLHDLTNLCKDIAIVLVGRYVAATWVTEADLECDQWAEWRKLGAAIVALCELSGDDEWVSRGALFDEHAQAECGVSIDVQGWEWQDVDGFEDDGRLSVHQYVCAVGPDAVDLTLSAEDLCTLGRDLAHGESFTGGVLFDQDNPHHIIYKARVSGLRAGRIYSPYEDMVTTEETSVHGSIVYADGYHILGFDEFEDLASVLSGNVLHIAKGSGASLTFWCADTGG